jgi:CubicO group peptidase (beta-lactamase class C family)
MGGLTIPPTIGWHARAALLRFGRPVTPALKETEHTRSSTIAWHRHHSAARPEPDPRRRGRRSGRIRHHQRRRGFVRGPQEPAVHASDAEVEAFLIDQLREGGYPGAAFAIVRDGRVIRSGGIGRADDAGRPVGADTPFVLGSLTKPITATAVMQLVEAGLVDLDAPVARNLDDFSIASGQGRAIGWPR